jgi:hypothetical protein
MNQRVSAFAFAVANYVRPLGLQRMEFSCGLSTGTAFPTELQGQK